MGNPGLPDPRVTDLSLSLSCSLLPPSLFSLSLSRYSFFFPLLHFHSILSSLFPSFLLFVSLSFPFSAPIFFHLYLTEYRQSKRHFRTKIPQQQKETFHFERFPSLFVRAYTGCSALLYKGLFVNNCDARRT